MNNGMLKWNAYVKAYRAQNPDKSFKHALQECSKTYKKKDAAPVEEPTAP
jgi:hypothetical protein